MTNEQTYSLDNETLHVTPFPSFLLLPTGKVVSADLTHFDYSGKDIEDLQTETVHTTLFAAISEDIIESILSCTQPLRLNDVPITTKNQGTVNVTLYTKPTDFENKEAVYVLCVPTDNIRSLDEEQQQLKDLKKGIHQSFMTITLDYDGFIIQTNQAFLKTSHWTPKRVIGKTFWQLFPNTSEASKEAQAIWKTIQNGQVWQGEVQKITKDEQPYWVHLTAIPLFGKTPQTNQYVLIEHDITKDKTVQFQLEKIAYIDPETNMMNVHRLAQITSKMIEENRHFSFVYLSIDKFYTIKDIHDDVAGNSLIIEFTKRMKMYFQDSTMARINENEFVVITPLPEWFTQGFLTYLQQHPIYNGSAAVPLSISGGITR
jgi:PAS domain S-box-containing protein